MLIKHVQLNLEIWEWVSTFSQKYMSPSSSSQAGVTKKLSILTYKLGQITVDSYLNMRNQYPF